MGISVEFTTIGAALRALGLGNTRMGQDCRSLLAAALSTPQLYRYSAKPFRLEDSRCRLSQT